MKLHPPEVEIPEEDPFQNALFNRKEFAQSLTALLRNVEESMVIFVNAPWGEGKTTFAEMWRAHLKHQEKLDVIYFDAYAADYFDDPFVSFTGEILDLVKRKLDEAAGTETEVREFQEAAVEVGKQLLGLGAKVGIRALTMGALNLSDFAPLQEVNDDLAGGSSEILGELIKKKLEGYADEKTSLKDFKEKLAKLASIVREQQGFPLTIIVDELDRCRPDFALQLLERIKHLFDVEGVAFLLLVNRKQIESYVRTVYGGKVDAPAYLLKFGTLFVDLPNQQPIFHQEKGRQDYCQILVKHHGFLDSVKQADFFVKSLNLLVERLELTLREVEKVFVDLSLYYSSLPERQITNEFLIAALAVIKIKKPRVFQALRTGRLSFEDFMNETTLATLPRETGRGVSTDWIRGFVGYLLMSDESFKKEVESDPDPRTGISRFGQWLVSYDLDRKKVIPFLCSRLDRFTINP